LNGQENETNQRRGREMTFAGAARLRTSQIRWPRYHHSIRFSGSSVASSGNPAYREAEIGDSIGVSDWKYRRNGPTQRSFDPFQLLLVSIAGWLKQQRDAIDRSQDASRS
jgi:hypothetical protein